MPSRASRNNVVAGSFVLVAIVAAVAVIIILSGALDLLGKREYRVHFPIQTGIGGLSVGSPVSVGGRQVGTVSGMEWVERDGRYGSIEVRVAVSKAVPLREGANAQLELPLLGGGGAINFSDLGDGDPLGEDDVIDGRLAPPGFLASAGFGDEQADQIRRILAQAEEATSQINRAAAALSNDVLPPISRFANDTGDRYPGWLDDIDATTANFRETSARGATFFDTLEERLDAFTRLMDEARSLVTDNRGKIDQTVDNALAASEELKGTTESTRAFANRLETEIADATVRFLEEASDTVRNAQEVVRRTDALLAEQSPAIRTTLANLRLGSSEVRATLAEVRQAPWRLVYRPDTRELEYELLYDAARAYAGAVGELRAATDSLDAAVAAGTSEQTRLEELADQLDAAFARYRDAETTFLDELREVAQN